MKSLLILCIAIPMLAQRSGTPMGWWDWPIVKDLNLTEDQTQKIRETVKEYRSKLIDERATAEKAEGELEDLFNEGNVDERKASEAIDRLANARADLTRTMSQMSLRLRSVLTQEQWRELRKRSPMRGRADAPRGPGSASGPAMMPRRGEMRRLDPQVPQNPPPTQK